MSGKRFTYERDLCAALIRSLPKGWTSYNETQGFDMVLVHTGGLQIAVEAKLTLNAKVLCQIIQRRWRSERGPDFRAVLVDRVVAENDVLARALGVTVLTLRGKQSRLWQFGRHGPEFPKFEIEPELPRFTRETYKEPGYDWLRQDHWFDEAPTDRLKLPEYVPDVIAGDAAPVVMGDWKVKAMKVCVLVEKIKTVTRADFRDLKIDPSRWMTGVWLEKGTCRGEWVAGPHFPADRYRAQHPNVFAEIEKDFPKWGKAWLDKAAHISGKAPA